MSRLATIWDAAWFGPVAAARPWLLMRLTLALLALDAWALMIERGGRYGAGGFNVAHFSLLDALPIPTPGLYVGLVLFCGTLAALATLGVATRALAGLLLCAWTWAWAMSQLDSYQHHYFLSWLLLALACLPAQRLRDLRWRPPPISAWGFKLASATCAVLYLFTAISKLEPAWTGGDVLRRLHGAERRFDPFIDLAATFGVSPEDFWPLAGSSVAVVQFVIAAAYVSVVVSGDRAGRLAVGLRLVGWMLATAFHVGAEHFGLRIGWFSYYMMVIATVVLVPAVVLDGLVAGPARLVEWLQQRIVSEGARPRLVGGVLCASAAVALAVGPDILELPGAGAAGLVAAVLLLGIAAAAAARPARLLGVALAGAITALALGITIDVSPVRFDFYRYVGGDATRRGEYQLALDAYGQANTFAPAGEERWKKVAEVKVRLRAVRPARD